MKSGAVDLAGSPDASDPETPTAIGRPRAFVDLDGGPGGGGGGADGTGDEVGVALPSLLGMLKIVLHCGQRNFRPNAASSCAIRWAHVGQENLYLAMGSGTRLA